MLINRLPRSWHPVDDECVLLVPGNGDDESTTIPDIALGGNAPHTTVAQDNCQLDTAQKKWGTASILYDGTNDRLEITTGLTDFDIADGGEPFTLEGWAYLNEAMGNFRYLFEKGGGGVNWLLVDGIQYALYIASDDKLYFAWNIGGDADQLVSTGVVNFTAGFHHFAVSQDGTTLRLCVDGDVVASRAAVTISKPATRNLMRVGARSIAGSVWNGWLDDVRALLRAEYITDPYDVPAGPFSPYRY